MRVHLLAIQLQIDGEVNILRGERDQAKDIIDDLSKKLNAVNAVIDEYQAERQVCAASQPSKYRLFTGP